MYASHVNNAPPALLSEAQRETLKADGAVLEYGPASVILTHPNEPVTEGGKLRPASRTAALIKQLKPPAHLAISGRTMEFDGKGRCVAGC